MPKKPEPAAPRRPIRRASGPRALGTLLPAVAKTAFKRGGQALAALATDWDTIVGSEMGRQTLPVKLVFAPGERAGGTLHIAASGSLALELQHLEPQVLERINGHFGYRAVERIRLVQDVARVEARIRRASAPNANAPAPPVDGVEDPDLRAALTRLGQALARRS
ncbi:MAG: DUF721 domain-containing protein [Alphaproteobacteria bacterium]